MSTAHLTTCANPLNVCKPPIQNVDAGLCFSTRANGERGALAGGRDCGCSSTESQRGTGLGLAVAKREVNPARLLAFRAKLKLEEVPRAINSAERARVLAAWLKEKLVRFSPITFATSGLLAGGQLNCRSHSLLMFCPSVRCANFSSHSTFESTYSARESHRLFIIYLSFQFKNTSLMQTKACINSSPTSRLGASTICLRF